MSHTPTVIGSWLRLIILTLDSHGINGEEFVKGFGVDTRLTSDPNYRVALPKLSELWVAAVRESGAEAFPLQAGANVHPTTFHALGIALWSSSSLKQLFQLLSRYLPLFSTASVCELIESEENYQVHIHHKREANGQPYAVDMGAEAALAAIVTICRSHYGNEFSLLQLELSRAAPKEKDMHKKFFLCPVSYDSPHIILYLGKSQIEAPIPHGNPALVMELEKYINKYLDRMGHNDLVGQIRSNLLTLLPQGNFDKEQIAESLHMSPRTLHRKLQREDTSYQALLAEVRKELGMQYIAQSNLSILEISHLLGFSDSNSFSRVFKQWKGSSPQDYRKLELGIQQ